MCVCVCVCNEQEFNTEPKHHNEQTPCITPTYATLYLCITLINQVQLFSHSPHCCSVQGELATLLNIFWFSYNTLYDCQDVVVLACFPHILVPHYL